MGFDPVPPCYPGEEGIQGGIWPGADTNPGYRYTNRDDCTRTQLDRFISAVLYRTSTSDENPSTTRAVEQRNQNKLVNKFCADSKEVKLETSVHRGAEHTDPKKNALTVLWSRFCKKTPNHMLSSVSRATDQRRGTDRGAGTLVHLRIGLSLHMNDVSRQKPRAIQFFFVSEIMRVHPCRRQEISLEVTRNSTEQSLNILWAQSGHKCQMEHVRNFRIWQTTKHGCNSTVCPLHLKRPPRRKKSRFECGSDLKRLISVSGLSDTFHGFRPRTRHLQTFSQFARLLLSSKLRLFQFVFRFWPKANLRKSETELEHR